MVDKRAEYKTYNHPAGGWGAAAATAKVLLEQSVVTKGSRALLAMNQPGGFKCTAISHHLGRGCPASEPMVHAGRSDGHHSDNPDLHRLGLLGFPRQGRCPWISLMQPGIPSIWKRLGWMVVIWSASVASLGAVAFLLRFILKTG